MLEQSADPTADETSVATTDLEAMLADPPADDDAYERRTLGVFFWVAVAWLVAIVLSSVFADLLPLKDPNETYRGTFRSGPSIAHWFGNDNIGQDVFSRTIYGARKSLGIAFTAQIIGFFVGGTIGLLAGYYRKRIEGVLTGALDILLAFPALILALVLALFSPRPRSRCSGRSPARRRKR